MPCRFCSVTSDTLTTVFLDSYDIGIVKDVVFKLFVRITLTAIDKGLTRTYLFVNLITANRYMGRTIEYGFYIGKSPTTTCSPTSCPSPMMATTTIPASYTMLDRLQAFQFIIHRSARRDACLSKNSQFIMRLALGTTCRVASSQVGRLKRVYISIRVKSR